MIRISTSGFIPLLFWKKWFRFKVEYDEGKLYDERIIRDPHIHHKSIAFKYIHSKIFQFTIGLDHYVFWGGHSERYGQFPDDFNSYILYITGSAGDDKFLETDQDNVAGNQLGAYHIIANIDFDNSYFDFRISHPFEDHSGMNLANFKDNLYSLYWKKKKTYSFINELLVEYLLTKSGDPLKNRRACDNYHNHGIYQTGFSYLEHGMGTPMFYPLKKNEEGTIVGFENNRISAFHFGAKGYFSKQINWKALFTYSRNFGTYHVPYDTALEQINFVGEIAWNFKNYPFSISAQIANDTGDLAENRTEFGLSLNRTF